jgi:dihydropteroate synthase-like protein
MAPAPFTWEVREIGLSVAGLMTAELIERRVHPPIAASRVMVPGRCRGDLEALSKRYGIAIERGPDDLKDIPRHFNREARPVDLSSYDIRIFAEIVDAPQLDVAAIVARARDWRTAGADVIDLGCLPSTPFAHLEAAVEALRAEHFEVSVDSLDADELLRGGRAGAHYLLSLTADTLWIADEVASTPVLIPREPADEQSLYDAIEAMQRRGRAFLADSIIEPLPFGLAASIARYQRLRDRYADVAIMIGIGNLTELTDADTSGVNALLVGIASELRASAVLTTQVSEHARRVVREVDVARRMMHAALAAHSLPKGLTDELLTVHAKHPFPDTVEEIDAIARAIRDPSFRVQIAREGIHVYNRDGHHVATDPFALFAKLAVERDGAHAFYLGVELARAEIAWRLGKRYVQDEPLDWGCAADREATNVDEQTKPGATLADGKATR